METEQIDALYTVAEVELNYKTTIHPNRRINVKSSDTAYQVFRRTWDENRIELLEQFKMLMLDRSSNCLGLSEITTGGMAHCLVDLKVVFSTALKAKAASLIFAHNHPSGNTNPSKEDIKLTKMLIEAGHILDIKVRDHLVLTRFGYTSMADNGYMP